MTEHTLQRNLTWLGLASLISIPFTGIFGLFAATGLFCGKIARLTSNESARKQYYQEEQEIQKREQEEKDNLIQMEYTERENHRNYFLKMYDKGSEIVKNYLSRLSNEEALKKVGTIKIYPHYQKTFLGIPYGKHSLEVIVDGENIINEENKRQIEPDYQI